MRFGPVPLEEAEGAILAHGIRAGRQVLKKGRVLTREDVAVLGGLGLASVTAARLDPDDLGEDAAATAVARAVTGANLTASAAFTGRCNLFAATRGLAVIDGAAIDRINLIDEAVTIATVAPHAVVEPGQMVATVKIIPYGVPRSVVEACVAAAAEGGPVLRVAPFVARRVALIQTRLPGMKDSVLESTVATTRARVAALGSELVHAVICDHEAAALDAALRAALAAGCDPVLVLGASAITDRRDIIPAAVTALGGTVAHLGMPVDPGNLLMLGSAGDTAVIGLPGCARSPKLNGFDWVLQRLIAGVPVTRGDLMRMGSGGLLMEIGTRPLPREAATPSTAIPRAPRIAAVVLAAGRSTRMAPANKLLASFEGKPLVAHTVDAALASQARPVIVVTGHQGDEVAAALRDRAVTVVPNPEHAAGMSSSLRAGLAAVPEDADGAVILLGDMPDVGPGAVDRLIAAFNPAEGRLICVPTFRAKRGNPVLWARRFFLEMAALTGDGGARSLLARHADQVCEVEMGDEAVLNDIDTPEALARSLANPPAGRRRA